MIDPTTYAAGTRPTTSSPSSDGPRREAPASVHAPPGPDGASVTRIRALVDITRRFAEATEDEPTRLPALIVAECARLVGGFAMIALITDDGGSVEVITAHADAHEREVERFERLGRVAIDAEVPSAVVCRTGRLRTFDLGDPALLAILPPTRADLFRQLGLGTLACAPMRARGRVIGALGLCRAPGDRRPFADDDLDLLQILADHAGQNLVNARLVQDLQRELAEHERTRVTLACNEERLRRAAKLEAVGRLAGGLAHDFNNLLSMVLSYSDIVLESLGPGHELRDDVEEIRAAGRRAAELTGQLLAFSRQQVFEPRVLDLNDVLVSIEPMLHGLLGEAIELRLVLAPDLFATTADPDQMEQLVMNLASHARDAMPQGGRLTIETGSVNLDEDYVRAHPEASVGEHAALVISDTGVGFPRSALEHLFEPFFSPYSKATAGAGLQLSAVYGIVQQSGGSVWVYSEPGFGTTFKIYLPRAKDGLEASSPEPARAVRDDARGTERVLLVEDDEHVRSLVRAILVRAGYSVLEACDGRAALALDPCELAGVDVLLTDVVMPGLSGPDLAASLAEDRPDMKVLFMSGYTEQSIVDQGLLSRPGGFLQKPVRPDTLLKKLRAVLDDRLEAAPSTPG